MKRSEINSLLADAKAFFSAMGFALPPWAYWSPSDWAEAQEDVSEITANGLGWDITDFGSGDFRRQGLLLFTIRNGSLLPGSKPYAEKIMIVEEGQVTPLHHHLVKTEDIINRGGGKLVLELYKVAEDGGLGMEDFQVSLDGIQRKVRPGERVVLQPGESICLTPDIYHKFYGEPGSGKVLVGEVSTVNDDHTDNVFFEALGRFPDLEEDAEPLHLLVTDYGK